VEETKMPMKPQEVSNFENGDPTPSKILSRPISGISVILEEGIQNESGVESEIKSSQITTTRKFDR
jgi:hypothetical protein